MRWLLFAARIFVVTGVFFGLLEGGIHRSVTVGVVVGLIFGLATAVAMTAVTRLRVGRGPGDLSVSQRAEVDVMASVDEAHARSVAAVCALPARIVSDTPGRIVGRTGVTWWSWGERVTIEVRRDGPGSRLVVESRPRVRTTVADYGRNRRNVVSLISRLREPDGGR